MFTGIIENQGIVREIVSSGTNRSFWIESPLSDEFKVDQSVAHDGVCLTVEQVSSGLHRVTAIEETLKKTNLESWKPGSTLNLERCLLLSSRIDGHFVQGHVDATGVCEKITDRNGSFEYEFSFPKKFANLMIEKGSICVNGISLTAFDVKKSSFRVAIIPYTHEHTNLQHLVKGSTVNLEFDLLGKYIQRRLSLKS